MNKLFAAGVVLSLASQAGHASAQSVSVTALYAQGERELAPNWRPIGTTANAAVFIHKDIRKVDNGYLAVWAARELASHEYVEKEKAYLSTRERVVIDCAASRIGISDRSYYAGRFGSGAIVNASRKQAAEMLETIPDSLEDRLARITCAPKPRATQAPKAKPAKTAKASGG